MGRRLLSAMILGVFSLSAAVAVKTQSPAATYPFGSAVITVPPPAGYASLDADQMTRFLASVGGVPGGAGVITAYAHPTSAWILGPGAQGDRDKFAMLATPPEWRAADITAEYFSAMAERLRTSGGMLLQRTDLSTIQAALEKLLQTHVDIGRPTIFGVFDDGMDRIGVLTLMSYAVNGSATSVVGANTILRVRNRLLYLYVYSGNTQPDGATALTSVARAWTDAIVMANNARPQPQRREKAPIEK